MDSLSDVSIDDFKTGLTPQKITVIRTIYCGLLGGPLLFGFIIVGRQLGNPVDVPETTLSVFHIVNGILAITCSIASYFVPTFMFSEAKLKKSITNLGKPGFSSTPLDECFMLILRSSLIQLAALEGASLFGLVCCFIGNGLVNALSSIPLLIMFFITFPTRNRVIQTFILKIKKDPRLAAENLM